MMIYAQRPNATACAEYDFWNEKMRRYVMRGSSGIALIDTSGDKARLRYVFDVADTAELEKARRPRLWQYRPEHQRSVSAALEARFGVSGQQGFATQIEAVSSLLAAAYWDDNQEDLLRIVDGSVLEEYDKGGGNDLHQAIPLRHVCRHASPAFLHGTSDTWLSAPAPHCCAASPHGRRGRGGAIPGIGR